MIDDDEVDVVYCVVYLFDVDEGVEFCVDFVGVICFVGDGDVGDGDYF